MGKAVSVSGKLEPLYFTITTEDDRQIAEVYAMKSGYFYRREFGTEETIKEMLSEMKSDLFSIQIPGRISGKNEFLVENPVENQNENRNENQNCCGATKYL